mmetsp:Transcript_4280/g.9596  ORF Transcript_4280/g.9596 Transcript_4280/m.9596 type:complete len:236 (+) Transcript_4280:403-1110(+)
MCWSSEISIRAVWGVVVGATFRTCCNLTTLLGTSASEVIVAFESSSSRAREKVSRCAFAFGVRIAFGVCKKVLRGRGATAGGDWTAAMELPSSSSRETIAFEAAEPDPPMNRLAIGGPLLLLSRLSRGAFTAERVWTSVVSWAVCSSNLFLISWISFTTFSSSSLFFRCFSSLSCFSFCCCSTSTSRSRWSLSDARSSKAAIPWRQASNPPTTVSRVSLCSSCMSFFISSSFFCI